MDHWTKFPAPDSLEEQSLKIEKPEKGHLPLINGHLHTPYSFSAFASAEQAIDLAAKENIKVAGINDFNTVNGYADWAKACLAHGIAPLFNIEMIGLNTEDQAQNLRVNDPSNPGRTYISGKGLSTNPLPDDVKNWLNNAVDKSNGQCEKMTQLLNNHLKANKAPFVLNFNEIYEQLTLGQVRERHIARALRLKVEETFPSEQEQMHFYKQITGKEISVYDPAIVENTLRGALLKAGGPAFIAEDPNAFADVDTIRNLILKAKGIPTYPFLGDALNGKCTDFEEELEITMKKLNERGFYSVEFITTRNSLSYLEETVPKLWNNGFLVTFGTEHNTPAMEPLVPKAKGGVALSENLLWINFQSVSIILAHQYLTAKTGYGWLDPTSGIPNMENKDKFIKIGWSIINSA